MQELTYQKLFSRIGACYFALLAGSQVLSAIVAAWAMLRRACVK